MRGPVGRLAVLPAPEELGQRGGAAVFSLVRSGKEIGNEMVPLVWLEFAAIGRHG